MDALRLFIAALFFLRLHIDGVVITSYIDYRDYDVNCIVKHLRTQHRHLYVEFESIKSRLRYCDKYMQSLHDSFFDAAGNLISPNTNQSCVINLLKRHNVSEVLVKAIAYNYFKRQLVKFRSNATCGGVVTVLRLDNDCEHPEMSAKFIGNNKSLWKLRPCLDDLFGEFSVDAIVFTESGERLGARRFSGHLRNYLRELVDAASNFCSSTDWNVLAKFYGIGNLAKKEFAEIYERPQIDCFLKHLDEMKMLGNTTYRFYGRYPLGRVDEGMKKCDDIMREQVESVITVDLFGFTEKSRNVKNCVIESSASEQLIEKVVVLPVVMRFIDVSAKDADIPQQIYVESSKKIIDNTLACLEAFWLKKN